MTDDMQVHELDSELERRLEEYVDMVRPGCDDSAIPPLTRAQYMPAVVFSVALTVAAILVPMLWW